MNKIELQNTKELIDNEFFIFVDFNNVVTKHNLEITKSFSSAAYDQFCMGGDFAKKYLTNEINYLPFIPNVDSNINVISMFNNSIASDYKVEYNFELHRKYFYPDFPSRLSACYAFADYETCRKVSGKYRWDLSTIRKFKLVESPINKIVKVNMEIISLERYANRVSMQNQNSLDEIGKAYWTGIGNIQMELPTVNERKVFNSEIIWEYLIEGRLELIEN